MMASTHYAYAMTVTATAVVAVDIISLFVGLPRVVTMWTTPLALLFVLPVVGQWALVPDADTPGSRISRDHPVFSSIFRMVFKKHRGPSHYLCTAVLMGVIVEVLCAIPYGFSTPQYIRDIIPVVDPTITVGKIVGALIYASAVSFLCGHILRRNHFAAAVIVLAALLIGFFSTVFPFFPQHGFGFAVMLGMMLHSMGDMHTPSGVAWLAPFVKKELHLPQIIDRTGSPREENVIRPLFTMTAIAASLVAFSASWWLPTLQQMAVR